MPRTTVAQAIVTWLANQHVERDGQRQRFFEGVFGIFGHGIVAGLGSNIRFYRTIMVNEIGNDYIRTARAKGLGEAPIMFKHLLKNAMIPILTGVVMAIPFLFMGSLLLESFFGIPGMGRLTVEAIQNNDFRTVSAMVYISSLLFIVANLATDISYTFVDPRVRLK